MRGVNKVMILGRLGADPEIRKSDTMRTKANLRVATSESYKNAEGNWVETTEWHTIVMWGPMADRAERDLKKGSIVFVEGKLKTRSWEDQNGTKRYATEVIADSFQFVNKTDEHHKSGQSSETTTEEKDTPSMEDGLPF